jgi:ATP-dependent DNA helicase RecQ
MQASRQILIKYWGYPNFRSKQEEIIDSVLAGTDTLALLPTGGGKSICYQVPGLLLDGITLVVTPLIALMKDQVENLKKRDIPAVALYSGLKHHEYEWAINQAIHGQARFLYLSPERLQSDDFLSVLRQLKVSLIAVDEAHCISQWGYDFRPPYLKIAEVRPYFPHVPIMALTATATPEVAIDIQEKLAFKKGNFVQKSFARSNLIYYVSEEENKLELLLRLAKKQQGSGIVYVRNRKKTQEIADFLQKEKISASFYHAGLDSRIRDERQKKWKEGFIRIIVATNAFGMGIDKDNVRFVAHLDLPDNPEAYFQEAGRAGRDGKKAYSVIFWEKTDLINLKRNFENSFPPISTIKQVYQALGNYLQLAVGSGKGQAFKFDIVDFSKQYLLSPLVAFNCIKILEKQGLLMMNEAMHKPSKVKMLLEGRDLYQIQVDFPKYDNLIKFLLRNYSGIFQDYTSINEIQIQKAFKIDKEQLQVLLHKLMKMNVLDYHPESNHPEIIFATERLSDKDVYLSPENYQKRKDAALVRLKAIQNYVESDHKCRSQLLLSYFGEEGSKRCGMCDVCLKRNKTDLSKLEFDQMVELIKPVLKAKPMMLDELVFKVETVDADRLLNAIQWLRENGKIREDTDQKLYWV